MKDQKAYNRIIRARTSLVFKHPFFASLALRLKVREDCSCQTAWTDGKVFAYNPRYVNILAPDKLEGLAAHVVMHPACSHHKRRQGRDHKTWNRACDYAINPILLDAGITLPDRYLYFDEYRGKSAETVYEILQQGAGDDQSGEAQHDVNEEDNTDQESSDQEEETGQAGDEGDVDNKDDLRANGDPGLSGEIRDETEGPSAGVGAGDETDWDETDWDEAVIQAAINAREAGKLPAGLELFIENKVNPKLCWQELLSRFIERSARSDYSWLSPNRRYLHQDLYFPSLINSELREVVIAIDTSGSIDLAEFTQFGAEVSEILEQYPAMVHMIYCDMKVVCYEAFQRSDLPIVISPKGGGGTDYRPVFEHVDRMGIIPACLIYLTDMECSGFPDYPPFYPVLWVKIGESQREPPFGETLTLISDF